MTLNRRLRSGYSNLGPIQIPPRPQAIVLTDRADGSKWLVSFNTTLPERLSIVSNYDTIRRREGIREYAADDGPKMDENGEFTLMVRGGRIGLEYTAFPRGEVARDDSPPYSRKTAEWQLMFLDSALPSITHIGLRS